MVGVEVVVKADAGAVTTADEGAFAVGLAAGVDGVMEAFGDEAPLDGDVPGIRADGEDFVDAPGGGELVEDDVLAFLDADGIDVLAGDVTGAEAEVTDDDLAGEDHEVMPGDGEALAGGGLACEGEEGVLDADGAFEEEGAGGAEDDGAGTGGFDGGAEGAWTGVVEVGDGDDAAAATADGPFAGTFSSWEGGELGVGGGGEESGEEEAGAEEEPRQRVGNERSGDHKDMEIIIFWQLLAIEKSVAGHFFEASGRRV